MSFDPECAKLARYFLPDNPLHADVEELAHNIQDCIEDWLSMRGRKAWRDQQERESLCEYCGENKPLHLVHTFDSCPTDRGEERREYDIYVCSECDRSQMQ